MVGGRRLVTCLYPKIESGRVKVCLEVGEKRMLASSVPIYSCARKKGFFLSEKKRFEARNKMEAKPLAVVDYLAGIWEVEAEGAQKRT